MKKLLVFSIVVCMLPLLRGECKPHGKKAKDQRVAEKICSHYTKFEVPIEKVFVMESVMEVHVSYALARVIETDHTTGRSFVSTLIDMLQAGSGSTSVSVEVKYGGAVVAEGSFGLFSKKIEIK